MNPLKATRRYATTAATFVAAALFGTLTSWLPASFAAQIVIGYGVFVISAAALLAWEQCSGDGVAIRHALAGASILSAIVVVLLAAALAWYDSPIALLLQRPSQVIALTPRVGDAWFPIIAAYIAVVVVVSSLIALAISKVTLLVRGQLL